MDIREYLQIKEKGFYKILCNNMTVERRKQFYDAVNNWHESELKLLNIHNVVKPKGTFCACKNDVGTFKAEDDLEYCCACEKLI